MLTATAAMPAAGIRPGPRPLTIPPPRIPSSSTTIAPACANSAKVGASAPNRSAACIVTGQAAWA